MPWPYNVLATLFLVVQQSAAFLSPSLAPLRALAAQRTACRCLGLGEDAELIEGDLEGEGRKDTGLQLDRILLCEVPNLSDSFHPARHPNIEMIRNSQGEPTKYSKLLGGEDIILYDHARNSSKAPVARALIRAGPHASLHFKPSRVNAAIVTCGGLCPGINSVVHHLVKSLLSLYGVKRVYGVRGGYSGFHVPEYLPPFDLTIESVRHLQRKPLSTPAYICLTHAGINHQGGSVLGSSRGGFDLEKTMQFIEDYEISQLFVIGGDGTHRGAEKIASECIKRNLNVAVAGIPKTIDNDIAIIDRSFGFITAVEAAQRAIESATVEAECNLPNGIGIVKVMGRSAGFIAAYSSLASGDVDLCLVPEAPIELYGSHGCLPHLMKRVTEKGWAVVVVAEGAGEELLGKSMQTDASGNRKLPAIGQFMRDKIEEYFRRHGKEATVKYIDPSYMIRSCPASAFDQVYCMQIAQNAVHGIMAGYTSFSAGMVNDRTCLLPIKELVAASPRKMRMPGRTWERVLSLTLQPTTSLSLNQEGDEGRNE